MKSSFDRGRHGRTFYSLLLPYLAILLATLLAGILLFSLVGRQYTRATEQLRGEQLAQLAVEVDYSFQYAINVGDSILFNPKLQLVARKTPLIYTQEDLRQDLLKADTQSRLSNYMVYLNNHDQFLTTGIMRSSQAYYAWYESIEGLDYDAFRQTYLEPYHLRTFLPPVTLQKHGATALPVIPYIQSAPLSKAGMQPDAQIILYLDARDILGLFDDFAQSQESHVYLLYPDGTVAMASAGAPAFDSWLSQGETEWRLAGERHFVHGAPLSTGAGRLVSASPYGSLYAGWTAMRRAMAAMVIAYIVLGVLAAVLLARMNYRPIREINALLGAGKGGNEYERIKRAVLENHADRLEMHSLLKQQRPLVVESTLLRLLNGPALLPGQDEVGLSALGIAHVDRAFYVVLCAFDMQAGFFSQAETLPDENLRCARIIVQNVGEEVLSSCFDTHFVATSRANGAFLLSGPAGEASAALLETLLKQCEFMQAFLQRECGLTLTVGISAGHRDVQRVPQCQEEAQRALEHALMMNQGGCVAYGALNPEEIRAHFYYPVDTDQRLTSLLRTGQFEEAKAFIESLYAANFDAGALSVHAGRCFVYQVGTTVDRLLISLGPDEGGPADEPLGELLRKLGGGISFAQAKQTTLAYVDKCQSLFTARKKGQTEQLADSIAQYIDDNAAVKWLDLGSLAETFGVTPQYISHIFKKYQGENVKDHISRRKLEEAKRCLRETDLTGEAISQRIGYASEAGLIRLFKKYEAVTPSRYRQMHRDAN